MTLMLITLLIYGSFYIGFKAGSESNVLDRIEVIPTGCATEGSGWTPMLSLQLREILSEYDNLDADNILVQTAGAYADCQLAHTGMSPANSVSSLYQRFDIQVRVDEQEIDLIEAQIQQILAGIGTLYEDNILADTNIDSIQIDFFPAGWYISPL